MFRCCSISLAISLFMATAAYGGEEDCLDSKICQLGHCPNGECAGSTTAAGEIESAAHFLLAFRKHAAEPLCEEFCDTKNGAENGQFHAGHSQRCQEACPAGKCSVKECPVTVEVEHKFGPDGPQVRPGKALMFTWQLPENTDPAPSALGAFAKLFVWGKDAVTTAQPGVEECPGKCFGDCPRTKAETVVADTGSTPCCPASDVDCKPVETSSTVVCGERRCLAGKIAANPGCLMMRCPLFEPVVAPYDPPVMAFEFVREKKLPRLPVCPVTDLSPAFVPPPMPHAHPDVLELVAENARLRALTEAREEVNQIEQRYQEALTQVRLQNAQLLAQQEIATEREELVGALLQAASENAILEAKLEESAGRREHLERYAEFALESAQLEARLELSAEREMMREELLEGVLSTAIENARLETMIEFAEKAEDGRAVGSPVGHGKIALQKTIETMAGELEREKNENRQLRARLAELERRLQELADQGKNQRVFR